MRVGFPGGPRLEWYDRNPQIGGIAYVGNGIAPHSPTQRASYTVPTGKKALLTAASLYFKRVTAATTAGKVESYVSASAGVIIDVISYGNSINDGDGQAIGQSVLLAVGNVVALVTQDGSTGGTVSYVVNAAYVEFNA